MHNFDVKATLSSDTGKHTLKFKVSVLHTPKDRTLYSTAVQQAVRMILHSQNCPESAIVSLNLKLDESKS